MTEQLDYRVLTHPDTIADAATLAEGMGRVFGLADVTFTTLTPEAIITAFSVHLVAACEAAGVDPTSTFEQVVDTLRLSEGDETLVPYTSTIH